MHRQLDQQLDMHLTFLMLKTLRAFMGFTHMVCLLNHVFFYIGLVKM